MPTKFQLFEYQKEFQPFENHQMLHLTSGMTQKAPTKSLTFRNTGFTMTSSSASSGFMEVMFSYNMLIFFSLSHPHGLQNNLKHYVMIRPSGPRPIVKKKKVIAHSGTKPIILPFHTMLIQTL